MSVSSFLTDVWCPTSRRAVVLPRPCRIPGDQASVSPRRARNAGRGRPSPSTRNCAAGSASGNRGTPRPRRLGTGRVPPAISSISASEC